MSSKFYKPVQSGDKQGQEQMNIRSMPSGIFNQVMEFMRPAFVQAAALCLRDGPDGREVLLVRTLQRQHWIIPKGWPMKNRTLAQTAEAEAWEEAGVRGQIATTPIGAFSYTKIKKSGLPVQCRPLVFVLEVQKTHDKYPEAGKRSRAWVSLPRAAEMVHNPELAALLRSL
jgi:8-oxo-dGTP pyrophosphatase MutT (NUDIX family)